MNGCDVCLAAENREPGALTLSEFPQDAGLQVDDRRDPFTLVFCAVVRCCKNGDTGLPYLFSVHVLHLVVAGDQQPAVLVAEPDHFQIRNIPQWLASLITEPFGEPLNCESSCRQTLGYGRSRKALVQKQDTFFMPPSDVAQRGLTLSQRFHVPARNLSQFRQHCSPTSSPQRAPPLEFSCPSPPAALT